MRTAATIVAGVFAANSLLIGAQVVRSDVSGVAVAVSVRDGNRTVTGLTAANFELRDNGVVQRLSDASFEAMPIDVTFVLDLSGSISEQQLTRLTSALREVGGVMKSVDRCGLMTFSQRIGEVAPVSGIPCDFRLPSRVEYPAGRTSLFDAVITALLRPTLSDRRRMVVLLSDGLENSSFLDASSLLDAARRVDVTAHVVIASRPAIRRANESELLKVQQALAAMTGGRFVTLGAEGEVGAAFLAAVDEFRNSYILRYTATGVTSAGWHEISVTLKGTSKHSVLARKGYFGSASR